MSVAHDKKNEKKDNKIFFPHIIVCEGRDAKLYLCYFLESLIKRDDRYDQIQVMDAGGTDELSQFIKTLPDLPKFSIVKTLSVIRDAEKDAKSAEDSVQNLLKAATFAVPDSQCKPRRPSDKERNVVTGYALFPFFSAESGAIENLCLQTLVKDNAAEMLDIVDCAISRVTEKFGKLKRPHKNRLHTYLSLTDDFVTLKLGETARAKAYNFDAPELDSLKEFLWAMLNAAPLEKTVNGGGA